MTSMLSELPSSEAVAASLRLKKILVPDGWHKRELSSEGDAFTVLQASHPAAELRIPLNAEDVQEIHLGLFRPRGHRPALQVRLTHERFWRKLQPHLLTDDPGGAIQDAVLGVFDVPAGAELMVRTLSRGTAGLAYAFCRKAQPTTPVRHRHNVGAVIDVHDLMSLQFDIHGADDLCATIAPYVDSDFDRICWGNAAGSFRASYFSEVMPPMGQGMENSEYPGPRRLAEVMNRFAKAGDDPLRVVIKFAHENGLQLWADDRICHTFDPAETSRLYLSNDFAIQNQHMRVLNMDGTPHEEAMLSLAFPEFRDLKVRFLAEQARFGVDGIYIDWTRKSPTVGWEPPVLDSFIAKTGKNPKQLPRSQWVDDWLAHRAGFVTQFMRELRAALDEVAQETGRRIPIASQIPGGWRLAKQSPACLMDGLDIATWACEGLVDIIAPGESLFHAPVNLDHFHALLAGTDCELWGCIHQRARECYPFEYMASPDDAGIESHVDPWVVMRTAADLYNQNANGVFLWESGELPTVPARWEILKNLGDREQLKTMFGPAIGFRDGRHRVAQRQLQEDGR